MTLKAVLSADEFGTVGEALQGEYKQDGDAYILDVQSVTVGNKRFALEDISGITSTLEKHKKWLKDAKEATAAFDGLNAEEAREALSKMEEMQNWKPEQKVAEQIEAMKKQLEGKHDKAASKWSESEKFLMEQVRKAMISSAAAAAVAKHGVKKGFVDLMREKAESSAFIEKDETGNFTVRVKGDDGTAKVSMQPNSQGAYMGIEELVASWSEQEDYSGAFAGTGASGSGASGSDSPHSPFSMPRLSRDQATNPAKYRQAKEMAEKTGRGIGEYLPKQ